MNTKAESKSTVRLAISVTVFFTTISLRANPIELPERPVTPKIAFLLTTAILLEIVCVWFLLRRSRTPRFFIFWLTVMNLVTYPAFVGLLRLLDDLRPVLAVLIGEALVVIVEGAVIYLICRFASDQKSGLSAPSALKCWLVSLVGNACSAASFPLLLTVYERFSPI